MRGVVSRRGLPHPYDVAQQCTDDDVLDDDGEAGAGVGIGSASSCATVDLPAAIAPVTRITPVGATCGAVAAPAGFSDTRSRSDTKAVCRSAIARTIAKRRIGG